MHAGKFIAERDTENIRTATRRLGITHPVVNDRQYRTWRAFGVQAWPTVVLVDPAGNYIGQHAGEFTFDMMQHIFDEVIEVYNKAGLFDLAPIHFEPDPAPAVDLPLSFPGKVMSDPASNLIFISDTGHNRVLVAGVSEDGLSANVIHTIGSGEAAFKNGSFSEAALDHPEGTALFEGTLYIADTDNHSIRAADLASGTLSTIAGTGEQGYSRVAGAGTGVALNSPWDLLESDAYIYIAMAGTHQIWRLYIQTREVAPFAGSGGENIDDGPNPRATLAQPSGLTTDEQRLIFADSESSAVRAADFSPEGYTQTLIGEGLFEFGDRDGKGLSTVRLQHCLGVAYHDGRIDIADTYNNKIKCYDISSKECTTALGSGNTVIYMSPVGCLSGRVMGLTAYTSLIPTTIESWCLR